MFFGLTALLLMVIVVPLVPPPPPPPLPPDGAVLDPPHATASVATALSMPQTNFFAILIACPPNRSIKLPRDVESEIPVVRRRAAARDLADCRPEGVREVQLKDVAARALLDGDARLIGAGLVTGHARRELAGQVHRRPHPHARSEADH